MLQSVLPSRRKANIVWSPSCNFVLEKEIQMSFQRRLYYMQYCLWLVSWCFSDYLSASLAKWSIKSGYCEYQSQMWSLFTTKLGKQVFGGKGRERVTVWACHGRPPLPQRVGLHKWVREWKSWRWWGESRKRSGVLEVPAASLCMPLSDLEIRPASLVCAVSAGSDEWRVSRENMEAVFLWYLATNQACHGEN